MREIAVPGEMQSDRDRGVRHNAAAHANPNNTASRTDVCAAITHNTPKTHNRKRLKRLKRLHGRYTHSSVVYFRHKLLARTPTLHTNAAHLRPVEVA